MIKQIPEMKNRMIKGCVVDCGGACGDCTRTGEPLDLKGTLCFATGEIDASEIEAADRIYVIVSDGIDEDTEEAFAAIREKFGDKAYCFAAGEYPLDKSRLFSRMAELKDEENIFVRPIACAGFEGLRHVVNSGTCPAPDDNSAIYVWALNGEEPSPEEFLTYYEMGKRS